MASPRESVRSSHLVLLKIPFLSKQLAELATIMGENTCLIAYL